MADTALAGERVGTVPAWAARLLTALRDRVAAESERRLLWLPVCFGAGIGIYFVLKVESPLWPAVAGTIAGAGLSFALRRHPAWCEAALALTVFAAGFALICETARVRQAPMLQRYVGPVTVTGRSSTSTWRRRAGASWSSRILFLGSTAPVSHTVCASIFRRRAMSSTRATMFA